MAVERTARQPSIATEDPFTWIFSASHIVCRTAPASRPLRPLTRSRSARAMTPTPTSARLHGREEAQPPVADALDARRSFRDDSRRSFRDDSPALLQE